MSNLFASVPDRCPDCDHPLDASVAFDSGSNTPTDVTISCPYCGFEESGTLDSFAAQYAPADDDDDGSDSDADADSRGGWP